MSGLYLSGFNRRALEVHPQILERDIKFKKMSVAAHATFAAMPAPELAALHKQFLTAIGGKDPADIKKEKESGEGLSRLQKMRQKHPNAYKAWSAEDDARLTELFRDNAKVSTLVKEFGRQRGAINSRLIRLGLVEPD